mmetsp:Transcript_5403/g.7802  ORF Transcript_5403/g.7802 Transcript_5403/m.7802 type:complete len:756 (+) Transcript_5403:102-2369(+)
MTEIRITRYLCYILCSTIVSALKCATGNGPNAGLKVIPDTWINDGFCDCPFDSLDEAKTEACSGAAIGGWPGIEETTDRSLTFQCPQQKDKNLPISRLNDGICDCCDGADEMESESCEDICDEVLAAERSARAKAEEQYKIGKERRNNELEDFRNLVKQTLVEIETAEKGLEGKNQEMDEIKAEIQKEKITYADRRRSETLNVVDAIANTSDLSSVSGLLAPLDIRELSLLIQLTCQIAGEMETSSGEKTCAPLRLAGVDLGILWSDEDFNGSTVQVIEENDLLIDLVDENSKGEKIWSREQLSTRSSRRRLDDYHEHEQFEDDYHYHDRDEIETETYHDKRKKVDENDFYDTIILDENKENLKLIVEGSIFSKSRVKFLNHADDVIRKIQDNIKRNENVAENNKTDESDTNNEGEGGNTADNTVRKSIMRDLQQRKSSIKRGFQFALSAHILVGSRIVDRADHEVQSDLINLAASTIMYSRVRTEHVWHMLSTLLPEIGSIDTAEDESCGSLLATICPAKAIERNGSQYPPPAFLEAGENACSRAVNEANAPGCNMQSEIPSSVPEGYYGYNQPREREQDDPLYSVFRSLENMVSEKTSELETRQKDLQSEISSIENNVKELEDKVGGRGQDDGSGEFFVLKDTCHSVTAGKYDYEVCVNGKATQKDKGAKSGTSLGKWQGMNVEKETGKRVMKWENGQKCWNGPSRSATVYVTCGAETKLLSAEEPDTCTYVLEMESYIACDWKFYKKSIAVA